MNSFILNLSDLNRKAPKTSNIHRFPLRRESSTQSDHSHTPRSAQESCEALRASRLMRGRAPPAGTGAVCERLGPGTYSASSAPLLRPDLVQLWRPLRTGLPEHLHGLFRLRSDSRALLDTEAPGSVEGLLPSIPKKVQIIPRVDGGIQCKLVILELSQKAYYLWIILPLPKARLRRSWSAEDIWRFYLPELDSPLGLANFARNLDFEDWQASAAPAPTLGFDRLWALQNRGACPSKAAVGRAARAAHVAKLALLGIGLSYSLPDLHITHERAPEADFGDSGRMNEDEEVEGDVPQMVLLLSLEAERELLHPRAPSLVDMGRQIGRSDGTVEDVDDFEELILSPKRPAKRVTCLVDMARDPGRPPDPEMDAHVWAEDHHDRVFCYKPLGGLADDEEELDLLLKPTPQAPSTDFGRPVGRPGLDPRAREEPRQEDEEEDLLLLQWSPPFIPARLPVPPPSPPPHQDAAGLEIPEH
ncbi:unnamed protein product [Symbiodinium pilosum]|uniref:Uncharacterized protein n=1 Tax=Symbiodinium pilosum TaxID=2952 RepID=A0A812SB81_SYMPI|nr:unnamed protein product [Symbiodinium pilosum]